MLLLQDSTARGSAPALAMEPPMPVDMAPANTMPDFKSSRRSSRPFPATGWSDTESALRRARAMSLSPESNRLHPTPYAMCLAGGSMDSVSAETRGLARDPGPIAGPAFRQSAGSIIDGARHAAACCDAIAIDADRSG